MLLILKEEKGGKEENGTQILALGGTGLGGGHGPPTRERLPSELGLCLAKTTQDRLPSLQPEGAAGIKCRKVTGVG